MRYSVLIFTLFLFSACSSSSEDNSSADHHKSEFELLVEKYHKIPAFPFQFTKDELYSEAKEISASEIKNIFKAPDEVIRMKALHFYPIINNYVLFSMYETHRSDDLGFRVDLFSKTGYHKYKMYTKPYVHTDTYKRNPKFEIRENELSLIYEEIYTTSEDGKNYRSFYSEDYDVNTETIELKNPTPFWMRVPRELFSPLVVDYLRKDGNFEGIVSESDSSFIIYDKGSESTRSEFRLFDRTKGDLLIGISHLQSPGKSTDGLNSTVSFIRVERRSLKNLTFDILNPQESSIHKLGCDFENFEINSQLVQELKVNGSKQKCPFISFKSEGMDFICFNSTIDKSKTLLQLYYKDNAFHAAH